MPTPRRIVAWLDLRAAVAGVLLLLFMIGTASGLALAKKPTQNLLPVPELKGRVVDQTGTLTPVQIKALYDKLAIIEIQRGAQVAVLLVPTTQPEDIAAYSQRVADTWKLGRRDVGDGVVIVVAKNDRRVNIEVAKSLEGAIPDVMAGRIINEQIKPAFKINDYVGGLSAAIDRLDQRIAGEKLPAPTSENDATKRAGHGFNLQDMAIFLFLGVPIVGAVLSGLFGRKLGAVLTGGAIGGLGWWLTASLLMAGGAALVALFLVGVMGVGGAANRLRSVGPFTGGGGSAGLGGRGGSGFSSGGGGDFGGGGASGSW